MADNRSPFLFLCISLAILAMKMADAQVPAIYIFGDSTADVGTNSFLPQSTARADFPHNGIDFIGAQPTGRFSNGFNTADLLAKLVGFSKSPPPYLSLTNATFHKQILRGVNFASGGSGILDLTGSTLGVVSMKSQIQQFEMVHGYLTAKLGFHRANLFFSKSLFFVSVGSNDILENYVLFGPQNKTEKKKFIGILTSTYKDQLTTLYKLGARKFGIISIPPIGCCPSQRAKNVSGGCINDLNDSALELYKATKILLHELRSEFKDMKYSLGNAFEMVANVFQNPLPSGFKNLTSACCGSRKLNGEMPCTPSAALCSNRHEFLFWDMYHPTQAASKIAAQTLYFGPKRFVSPINFKKLAEYEC